MVLPVCQPPSLPMIAWQRSRVPWLRCRARGVAAVDVVARTRPAEGVSAQVRGVAAVVVVARAQPAGMAAVPAEGAGAQTEATPCSSSCM